MNDALALGSLVDLVIAITVAEGAALVFYHCVTRKGVAPREYIANLLSGLCLMLALRCFAHGTGTAPVAICLLAAGVAHGTDLWMRWRRDARARPPIRKFAA